MKKLTTKYVKSPIDNKIYCRKNGQFLSHLRLNGYENYQKFYEDYYPLKIKYCACGKKCKFDKTKMTYKQTCGTKKCANNITSAIRSGRTKEEWDLWREKYRTAMAKKSPAEIAKIIAKRVETGTKNNSYINSVVIREATCLERHGDKNYNNSVQISETKLNWDDDRKQLFLERWQSTTGCETLNDFHTPKMFRDRRMLLEERGDIIPWDQLSEWEQYKKTTRMLTEQNYRKNKDIINPDGYVRSMTDYELDHIMPIYYGYVNNISESDIAKVENLQMLKAKDNRKKGKKYG